MAKSKSSPSDPGGAGIVQPADCAGLVWTRNEFVIDRPCSAFAIIQPTPIFEPFYRRVGDDVGMSKKIVPAHRFSVNFSTAIRLPEKEGKESQDSRSD